MDHQHVVQPLAQTNQRARGAAVRVHYAACRRASTATAGPPWGAAPQARASATSAIQHGRVLDGLSKARDEPGGRGSDHDVVIDAGGESQVLAWHDAAVDDSGF